MGNGEKILAPLIVNILKIKSTLALGGGRNGEKKTQALFFGLSIKIKENTETGGRNGGENAPVFPFIF